MFSFLKRLKVLFKRKKPRDFFEKTATSIATMERTECIRRIKSFKGKWALDFTDDYLNDLDINRLRHILLAAYMHGPKNPKGGSP